MTKPSHPETGGDEIKQIEDKDYSSTTELQAIFFLSLGLLIGFLLWAPDALTGVLGEFFSKVAYGFLGNFASLSPLFFIYLAAESYFGRRKSVSGARKVYILSIIYFLITLISLLSIDISKLMEVSLSSGRYSAWQAIRATWLAGQNPGLISSSNFWTGGLMGGVSAFSLIRVIGFSGSMIVTLAMLLAMIILTFDVSLRQTFQRTAESFSSTGHKVKSTWSRLQDKRQVKKEDKMRKEQRINETGDLSNKLKNSEIEADNESSFSFDFPQGNWMDANQSTSDIEPTELGDERIFADDFGMTSPIESNHQEKSDIFDFYRDSHRDLRVSSIRPHGISYTNDFDNEELGYQEDSVEPSIRSAYIPDRSHYFRADSPVAAEQDMTESSLNLDEETNKPTNISDQLRSEVASTPEKSEDELSQIASRISEGEDFLSDLAGREDWEDRGTPAKASKQIKAKVKKGQMSFFGDYLAPPIDLLIADEKIGHEDNKEEIRLLGAKLEKTLNDFGVDAQVINFITGPTISRFEVRPGAGVKVSRIVGLADDIALALAATSIRIEAPIPGKSAVGIEIPNKKTQAVRLRDIIESPDYKKEDSKLTAALGRNIQGEPILTDLSSMPHVLIAGATGSGKSVCINSILISLLYKSSPKDLRMVMIDPKVVELSVYNGIPHLAAPVVTDPKKAYGVLEWAVKEMEKRYQLFAQNSVRDFKAYNQLVAQDQVEDGEHLPYILLVIDELSDLMMTTPTEVEDAIARLTSMARAAGIHLIIATQRPSVDVITGVIKANIPSRISFAVASQVDSRTILDMGGAEKLLGKGDMLYYPQNASKPLRGQGAFVTDQEVERVVSYLKNHYTTDYNEELERELEVAGSSGGKSLGGSSSGEDEEDELLYEALATVVDNEYASVSLLQRRLNVGYPRAARMIDAMHDRGWIGPFEGSKPRKLMVTADEAQEIIELNT